ncbi:MAG: NUDIX domain-containing protein [Christensenellales bacterium]|jgi:ADP-ribose pyrophosphatase
MNDKAYKETVLSGETLFEGAIMTVEKWRVKLPDGREADREIVLHKGAAAVVPVDAQGYVTLVRQHRVAIDEMMLEIPAGKLNYAGEDPFICAQRELEEETGLVAAKWQKLAHVVTTPGFCTERIALYLATELRQTTAHPDVDEFLNVLRMPLTDAIAMVNQGKITDAKTCLGLLMAQQTLGTPLNALAPTAWPKRPQPGIFPRAQNG